MANNTYYYSAYPFYYPPPIHYSYGMAATYHYGYGGYYSAASVYGPYGGAGRAAGYNPATGTYARSASVYGPYGSAGVKQAYNPYTGARARGRHGQYRLRIGEPGCRLQPQHRCLRRGTQCPNGSGISRGVLRREGRTGGLGRIPLGRIRFGSGC